MPIRKLARLKAIVGGSLGAHLVWFGARRFETLVSAIEASTWLNLVASTLIIVASYALCRGGWGHGAQRFGTLVSAIEASTWLNLVASTLIIVASYVLCSGGCSYVASGFVLPLCLTSSQGVRQLSMVCKTNLLDIRGVYDKRVYDRFCLYVIQI